MKPSEDAPKPKSRPIENVSAGCLTVFFLVVLAGLFYSAIYKVPSDGFLFDVLFLGSPLLLIAWLAISFFYDSSSKVRSFIRWFLLAMIVLIVFSHLCSAFR